MPTITIEFTIEHALERQPTFATRVNLANLDDFWKIVDLGFPDTMLVKYGNVGGRIKVHTDLADPRLSMVFEILANNGYRPSQRRITTPAACECEFEVIKHRTYSEEEIASSPLLMLKPRPNDAVANWCGGDDDHGWIAEAGKFLKKKLEIGRFNIFPGLLLGSGLHHVLEQSDLVGLEFIPIRYDHPERASRQLWQFGHKVVMPRCLLPRQDDDGSDYVDGVSHAAYWDDGGYLPPELRFVRREVEALGKFDIARTKEKAGNNPPLSRSEVIVSQRFREFLEKAKIKTIEYVPVRLID